ncbi:MAG TPA: hypothetical protein VD998_03505 [Verrucomicrobiae bacterium]|nr:hypothetical protein [Verrucomicrobiae bacterium]
MNPITAAIAKITAIRIHTNLDDDEDEVVVRRVVSELAGVADCVDDEAGVGTGVVTCGCDPAWVRDDPETCGLVGAGADATAGAGVAFSVNSRGMYTADVSTVSARVTELIFCNLMMQSGLV